MDLTSNFQNHMPISNGSFAKTRSIQKDAVSNIKPSPVSILDRFRAMVKEKEEEYQVFGGEAFLPLGMDEIVRIYDILLSSLSFNSKPIITDLTIIAGDQRAHGEGIADAICARIIEVPVNQKLPSLYLLDSIVKNIGKEYIRHFSARLPEVFCDAYLQVDRNMQPALRHLFGTWAAVFPPSVLHRIEAQLHFSPSVHGQASSLNSLRASESPRPSHGVHINPKYLDSKHRFQHSSVDTALAEDAFIKPLPSAAMVPKYAPSHGTGRVGSLLSSSLEEYTFDSSPKRLAIRASPSHATTDYGLGRVIDREEELQARNWAGNLNRRLKTNHTDTVDLRGPRALINAYGMDEREKNLKRKAGQPLEMNDVDQNVGIRTWQNTEEEEFDWEEDRKWGSESYPSGNLIATHRISTKNEAHLATDYRSNWSKAQSSAPDSSIVDNITHASDVCASSNKVAGVLPNVGDFARASFNLPSQQLLSHFNAGGPKPPVMGNLPTNGKLGDTFNAVSTFNQSYDPPAPEIRSTDGAALTKAWHPSNSPTSHHSPSGSAAPMQMQIRGQFGDQRFNEPFHFEHHLDSCRSTPHAKLPQIPNYRPVPLHLQDPLQSSQTQPNPLIRQDVRPNVPLPAVTSAPSNQMMPPPMYAYRGHGPTSSNLPAWPNSNAPKFSFNNIRGPVFPSPIRGTHPIQTPLNIGQSTSQVNFNSRSGGALSGLFSSLVAQGLISLNKQDSVGVVFDPDKLKVRHESAITALYASLPRQCTSCGLRFVSQEEHSKHMDWHVTKNRTLNNRRTKPSPKWFVSVNMWLSGAEAVRAESVPGFLPAENTVEKKEDEEMAVPADEDQNTCALCGEPFDDFYSDDTEEWMCRGAVYMYASGGSTVGIDRSQLGPIVHVKCRSDSYGLPSDDFVRDEPELAFSLKAVVKKTCTKASLAASSSQDM